ncbi:DEAD/DEAH box helicase [Palleronia sp. KMU-117]|uniref:DEAD/DEAH box helicase n=1 Tax=Palleronia sp. KMU-117 TaxID=3434108 RepID=UPI003D76159E
MSDTQPVADIGGDAITIRFPEGRRGLLARFSPSRAPTPSFRTLPEDHRDLLFALADLRAWGEAHPGEVDIGEDRLTISHDAAASLSSGAARSLGLPPDVHLTLKTDVTGTVGRPNFRLVCEWMDAGQRVSPRRHGAFLHTAAGTRRLPLWMKRALDLAEGFNPDRPMEDHWEVLAAFRRTLEPETDDDLEPEHREIANLAMTVFLRGLEVRIADRFSISPDATLGHFEVVPFSGRTLEAKDLAGTDVSEADAELSGEPLAVFQHRMRQLGARPAYHLGNNSYLVIDRDSQPVLEEMARVQKAPREERRAFVANPRAFIDPAVTRHLAARGDLDDLDEAGQQEMVERLAGAGFVESREYSERVTGTKVYEKPASDFGSSGTVWLPEVFAAAISAAIEAMPTPDLEALRDHMAATLEAGSGIPARIGSDEVEVTPERLAAVESLLQVRREEDARAPETEDPVTPDEPKAGPIILDTLENYEDLAWAAELQPRKPARAPSIPETVTTPLREHQVQSFEWATAAWTRGLPGILNADEQGLGKTLQTIAFLNWLQAHMQEASAAERGPIMVVAPTSLLRNWEAEVDAHVAPRKFGHLVRLYGSSLAGHKRSGTTGTETGSGLAHLDLDWLSEAFEEGRAHRYWFLTTYTTLANYQHSLGRIRFSALVMDEIQNIKNKDTIASKAVEAMNADFRIGLTGTPIENSTMDLWTIMDRIAPGALGSGVAFRERYGTPDEDNMRELHNRVFAPQADLPPLGLRRLKDQVARDLPRKTRLLHPGLMPDIQARTYDVARAKLASGGPGAMLKMLHHIRSVSVHPALHEVAVPETFVGMSARLDAAIRILSEVRARGERALVFIEHREMQFRFAELVRHMFGLEHVDIINGDTPIPRRQQIVVRFQQHLTTDGGFDLLILGPKAAGTGLTLTAATHVIHLSRWWNPAVEEQCNDRVHRIGQMCPVTVHVPMAIHPGYREHSFDCLLQSLMQRKRRMAEQALWPMGDTTEDLASLQASLDVSTAASAADPLTSTMTALFERDGLKGAIMRGDGTYEVP